MFSLANNFSKLNYNVHVIPDHKFSKSENFKTTNNLEKEFDFRALNSGLYYIEIKTPTEKVIKTISIL